MGLSSQQMNQPTKQSNQKTNRRCSYCSGDHYSHECTKYKTVNTRKDRVMSLKLCFNCLTPGNSSKTCCSTRTCRTCGLHHSSLCIKAHSNSNSSEASNSSTSNSNSAVSQGKSNQSSTSTSSTNRNVKAQAQSHPNKSVVTPNKTNASQASSSPKVNSQSPAIDTTYVTSVNCLTFLIMSCQLQCLM